MPGPLPSAGWPRWETSRARGEAEPIATREGNVGCLLHVAVARSCLAYFRGALAEAIARMSEAVEICEREGMPWTPIVLALKAQMELKKGAWASARPTLDEACRLPLEGAWDGIALGHRLLGLAYMGSEETGSILAKRDSYLPTAGIDGRAGQWYYAMALGEAAAYLGMKRESAMTYPLLRQLMEEGAVTLLSLGLVEKVAGIAAAAGGDWESSERHFEAALGQAETLPVEIEEPDVRRWYAWMLRERSGPGDEEKSRSVLDAAKAGYAKLGMAEFVELVEKDFE